MGEKRRIIVGITGASGVVMGHALLKALRRHPQVESHLITTKSARFTLKYESDMSYDEFVRLAHVVHDEYNFAASIASGSFVTEGMVVIPCSMKSLAGIVSGYTDNLLLRAADVCLKEGRRLVLVPREMPLGQSHLRNLLEASRLGCAIIPPMLTFYNAASTLEQQVDHVVGKVMMQFGLEHEGFKPWEGYHEPVEL